jgi:hypothetical protein
MDVSAKRTRPAAGTAAHSRPGRWARVRDGMGVARVERPPERSDEAPRGDREAARDDDELDQSLTRVLGRPPA